MPFKVEPVRNLSRRKKKYFSKLYFKIKIRNKQKYDQTFCLRKNIQYSGPSDKRIKKIMKVKHLDKTI